MPSGTFKMCRAEANDIPTFGLTRYPRIEVYIKAEIEILAIKDAMCVARSMDQLYHVYVTARMLSAPNEAIAITSHVRRNRSTSFPELYQRLRIPHLQYSEKNVG